MSASESSSIFVMPIRSRRTKRCLSGCATKIASRSTPGVQDAEPDDRVEIAEPGDTDVDEEVRLPQPVEALAPHPDEERDADDEEQHRPAPDQASALGARVRHRANRAHALRRGRPKPGLRHQQRQEHAEHDHRQAARDDRQAEVDEREPDRQRRFPPATPHARSGRRAGTARRRCRRRPRRRATRPRRRS